MPEDELELEWVEMVKGIEEEKRTASTAGPLDMFKGMDNNLTLLRRISIVKLTRGIGGLHRN